MMEWEAPSIVLQSVPLGEADARVLVLSGEHGAFRGLVRGGASRRQRPSWEIGNIVSVRWVARTSEQLGSLTGELVEAPGGRLLDDPLLLALLTAACATGAGALPERVAVPEACQALLLLLARLVNRDAPLAAFIRWELALLRELGFGLDLERCAVTGATEDLRFVSPRTGRAVAAAAAGVWETRLLSLPGFLLDGDDGAATDEDLLAGLRLTGHFLGRDAFGQRHQAVPAARVRLFDMLASGSHVP